MFNVNGFLRIPSRNGRRLALDFRAPEDRLLGDRELRRVRRSEVVSDWIDVFREADKVGDEEGRVEALKGVIDTHRADMAASGVPVFAHAPLPGDFAEELALGRSESSISDLLAKAQPGVRRLLGQQLTSVQKGRGSPTLGDRLDPLGGFEEREGTEQLAARSANSMEQNPPKPRPKPPELEAKHQAECKRLAERITSNNESILYWEDQKKSVLSRIQKLTSDRKGAEARYNQVVGELQKARSTPNPCAPAAIETWPICQRIERERRQQIERLEADLEKATERLADLDASLEQANQELADIKQALQVTYRASGQHEREYEALGCGRARDLWPGLPRWRVE
jgi:hypothetical protein